MKNEIRTILLCGGRGKRLRPVTDRIPKPLVQLNGRPILEYVISYYKENRYSDFIVCTGYHGEKIEKFVREKFPTDNLEFSNTGENTSMLKRLQMVTNSMSDRIFVAYGDTLVNVDLENMINDHLKNKALITITGAYVKSPFGLFTIDNDNKLLSFKEKPKQLYYVGQFIAEKSVFENLDPMLLTLPDGEGLIQLFQNLIKEGKLYNRLYEGPQITFNTQDELQFAEKEIINFYTSKEK